MALAARSDNDGSTPSVGMLLLSWSGVTQSPAQSFVPLTLPTSLQSVVTLGLTWSSGLLPTAEGVEGGVCARAPPVEESTIAMRRGAFIVTDCSFLGPAEASASPKRLTVSGRQIPVEPARYSALGQQVSKLCKANLKSPSVYPSLGYSV
jgi:hypothetical protein